MKTKTSDTPRTDDAASEGWSGDAVCVSVEFSQQLERELAQQWQPIETAPKAGSVFLAFAPHDCDGYQYVAVINTKGDIACMMSGETIHTPTHWMPLPANP